MTATTALVFAVQAVGVFVAAAGLTCLAAAALLLSSRRQTWPQHVPTATPAHGRPARASAGAGHTGS